MKNGWRLILIIVAIVAVLGILCIGVGAITGGDFTRIWETLDARYHVDMYLQYFIQVWAILKQEMLSVFVF